MDTRTTLFLVLITAGIFGLLLWGGSSSRGTEGASASSDLVASAVLYDFGQISMKEGKTSTNFTVTNPTAGDVTLSTLVTSCMCTEAFIINGETKRGPFGMPGHGGFVPKANEIIKAGENRTIEVVYDPNAHGPAGVGPIQRSVYLAEPGGETLELHIKAVVTP